MSKNSTSPKVIFGVGYSSIVKQDASPTIGDLQPFSNADDIRTDRATNRPYATYEPDFWLLDGEYKFISDELPASAFHVGIMTATLSDSLGDWATPPTLTINFSTIHTIEGLTFYFSQYSDDYPVDFDVSFYDASDVQIGTTTNCTPDSSQFYLAQDVVDFKKIVVVFNTSNNPYRYLRVKAIDFGKAIIFAGSDVLKANVVESTHPIAIEAPYDEATLNLFSGVGQFSPINPGGDYSTLSERQPLTVVEEVGNQTQFIGQFYLDEWENISDTEIEFKCTDILGVLDKLTHKGGIWLGAGGIAVEDLLNDMLTPLNVAYDLDASLVGTVVKGWLPIATYRENLQQIAFAIGAYLDTSRDRPIKIYPAKIAADETTQDLEITKALKGMKQSVKLSPLVTEVQVIAHNIIYGGGLLNLFDGTLSVGTHEIQFKQPVHGLVVTGATVTESGANYAILTVSAAGAVTLKGYTYVDTRKTHSVDGGYGSEVIPNIIKIEEASLVNEDNADAVAQRVYDYYSQRLTQEVRMYAADIQVGDVVLIDTLHNQQIRAVVENIETDLSLGMTQQVKARGVAL